MASKLAFGVEPSKRRYHLRLARYQGLADAVREFRTEAQNADRPLTLLDVGAGHGRTLMYLAAAGLDENMSFTGIDNAPERRERLFQPERWDYLLGDIEGGLPYPDASFDIVVCEQVLEHIENPGEILAEIRRVLRPGGMAVLGVPSFPPGMAAIRRHLIPRIDRLTGKKRDHAQVFTKRSFTSLVRTESGMEIQAVRAFRCFSGGPFAPLENFRWWYRLNRFLATRLASLAIEIQVIARR